MTFRQIELFVLVCQHQSIARVSELNFVSPQSISRMIKDLEVELNCSLFHRTKSGLIPTDIGIYLNQECIEILEKKELLINNIYHMNQENKESITVGMAMGSIATLNYHVFHEFQETHSNLEIQYAEFIDDELDMRFLNGEFDFCISTKAMNETDYLNTKLLSEQVYLSIPSEHPLYTVTDITMEDLKEHEFAMFTEAFRIRKKFMQCFEGMGFIPNIKIASSDFNSIKNLAYTNNLLTLNVQHNLKKEHGFRHVPFPCPSLLHELWIIKKKQNCSQITEQLYQYIIHQF